MKTYLATIETPAGTQTIQLAAANLQDAQYQVEASKQSNTQSTYHYTIQQVSPLQSPEVISGLASATGGLLCCLVFLAVAEYKLRKYFKG
jgi:hypothetical protein